MPTPSPSDLKPRLERAYECAGEKVRATILRTPNFFPMYTVGGKWKHSGELWTDWCAGFHAGMMWLIARRTGDSWWRTQAEYHSRLIEYKQHDRDVHDLGFVFLNSYKLWYELSGDPDLRAVLIQAGRTLALRFQPNGQYLRSFVAPESLFIDIMMNVPIIFYAARETGDKALYDLAVAHCRTTERTIVRPDGGTAHEGIFNPDTGEFLRQSTHQGLRPDSDWTRGLAWSLYGFTTVYSYTKDPADLSVARRNADHFLFRLGDSFVPPWDFDDPDRQPPPRQLRRRAIAASGLLDLSAAVAPTDPDAADRYRNGRALDPRCLVDGRVHRLVRAGVGGPVEARGVPRPQEPRRERVRHVGRLLLPGGGGQGSEVGLTVERGDPLAIGALSG